MSHLAGFPYLWSQTIRFFLQNIKHEVCWPLARNLLLPSEPTSRRQRAAGQYHPGTCNQVKDQMCDLKNKDVSDNFNCFKKNVQGNNE
jgi:hypothetical protein